MKKIGISILIALTAIFLAMLVVIQIGEQDVSKNMKKLVVVETPEQTEPMENEAFKKEEYVPPVIEGTNVALTGNTKANAFNDVYEAKNSTDGDRGTYWEGSPNEDVDELVVELDREYPISTLVIGLNPAAIWSKRTQTIAFAVSTDGVNYTDVVPATNYEFDPKTGNQIVVELDSVTAKYVRASISKNTGAVGGQVAEFEIYSK